ncbi:lipase 2 [Oleoguttula sp. CCFEE 5521]
MILIHRTALRRRVALPRCALLYNRYVAKLHASTTRFEHQSHDPRLKDLDLVGSAFAALRESYATPKHPIILAHGLLGFEELHLVPDPLQVLNLPGLKYWRGITDALAAKNVEVITASVPASGSIEQRADALAVRIEEKAKGKAVNIIAHSMLKRPLDPTLNSSSGLDSRYMISRLKPSGVKVLSLTTIATPHRGSAFADHVFRRLKPFNVPKLYKALEAFGFETGAFEQLTQKYMIETFNPATPDDPDVRYFSYGATLSPHFTSVFRSSHRIIDKVEGANDGLVSVESSRWGKYQGTLDDVSHLDLINWTNRWRWYLWGLTGHAREGKTLTVAMLRNPQERHPMTAWHERLSAQ